MKPFDLQEALNGAPVKLRSGQKAYVIGISKIATENDNSYIIGEYAGDLCNWSKNGKYGLFPESKFDIIGMWEEPELTSEQVLEKAYEDDLLVLCDGNPDLPLKVIAKTKNGEFVVQPEDATIQPWLANLTMEWGFVKSLEPKSDTITVTLPKPFKPKPNDKFWFIDKVGDDLQVSHKIKSNYALTGDGNYFVSEADAQAWLDAMKNALRD